MLSFTEVVCKIPKMESLKTLIFATICSTLSAWAYYREGCLETHIVSNVPFNQSSLKYINTSLKDLNDSTVILNCYKPCHISIEGIKSGYDKYEVFSFKLSKNQFESLNETLDKIIQVKEDDDYIITFNHDILHVKLCLWWTCFDLHAHGDMNHVLRYIN